MCSAELGLVLWNWEAGPPSQNPLNLVECRQRIRESVVLMWTPYA